MRRASIGVVGGDPGGLMVAQRLAEAGCQVTVYEHMASVGRKFLVAGRGGLNLTHSEPTSELIDRYREASPVLGPAVGGFDADALRAWAADLGEPTFVGSSGRVFPTSMRATGLLRAWLGRLDHLGVDLRTRHRWVGFGETPTEIDVENPDGTVGRIHHDAVVLALGGASWPSVGSDGRWVEPLRSAGIAVSPLRPANAGVLVEWSAVFVERFAGQPIKNCSVRVGSGPAVRGDVMVTDSGLEGGPIYGIGAELRTASDARPGAASVMVDLQPDLSVDALRERLERRRPKESLSSTLRRTVGLSDVAIGVLREATGNNLPTEPDALAALIGAAPIPISGFESLGRAISTAGGVELAEVDDGFMLRRRPGVFVVGEMLDWEAPTGGYLLQATFSVAVAAAAAVVQRVSVEA